MTDAAVSLLALSGLNFSPFPPPSLSPSRSAAARALRPSSEDVASADVASACSRLIWLSRVWILDSNFSNSCLRNTQRKMSSKDKKSVKENKKNFDVHVLFVTSDSDNKHVTFKKKSLCK